MPRELTHILSDGMASIYCSYAPYCKHLFIENFTDTRVNVAPITQSNARLLQSDYEARAPHELPV